MGASRREERERRGMTALLAYIGIALLFFAMFCLVIAIAAHLDLHR